MTRERLSWCFALSCLALLPTGAGAFRRLSTTVGADNRASPALAPTVWAHFPWGGGDGQVGRLPAEESGPECPASFHVNGRGELTLLDQVNQRLVQVGDGDTRTIPIAADIPVDLAPWGDDGWVLLDRKVGSLLWIDARGRRIREQPLQDRRLPKPGGLTALTVSAEGYWVEYDRETSVLVARPDGSPVSDGPSHVGTPDADGARWIRGRLDLARRSRVTLDAWRSVRSEPTRREVFLPRPVWMIHSVDVDAEQVVVSASLLPSKGAADTADEMFVVSLDHEGRERWRRRWRPDSLPDLQHRSVRLGQDGAVYALSCEPRGAVVRRLP